MLSKQTLQEIELIKLMDLKAAVPSKYTGFVKYYGATTTEINHQYIHVPSLLSDLMFEIEQSKREVQDIKAATKLLFGVLKETKQTQENEG